MSTRVAPVPSATGPDADGVVLNAIAFVEHADHPGAVLVRFPDAGRSAVLVGSHSIASEAADACAPAADLVVLTSPAAAEDAGSLPERILAWVGAQGPAHLVTMHGAVVSWSSGRVAMKVDVARVDSVRAAVVDFCFRERELRAVEDAVAAAWPHVEADADAAFEFRDRDADRRHGLAERFRGTVALRARLARLAPHLDQPPTHPPTLASQVGERMRERGRLAERAGFLADRLEVQERVYELCGQRASDWALMRRSTTLEWVIVVLLAIQTVLILVDLLAHRGI